jgi:hypothetical protein
VSVLAPCRGRFTQPRLGQLSAHRQALRLAGVLLGELARPGGQAALVHRRSLTLELRAPPGGERPVAAVGRDRPDDLRVHERDRQPVGAVKKCRHH